MLREYPTASLTLVDENAIFRDVVVDVPNLSVDELLGVILVHEHFTTSESLFREVTSHFSALSSRNQSSEVALLRFINFIKNWIKMERDKFRPPKGPLASQFVDFCNQLEVGQAKWKLLLETTLLEDDTVVSMSLGVMEESEDEPVYPEVLRRRVDLIDNSGPSITYYEPEEIARQLTLIDLRNFKEIRNTELMRTCWLRKPLSAALAQCMDKTLSHYIAHDILKSEEKCRQRHVQHWMEVGEALARMNNFQSARAVYNGLMLGSPELNEARSRADPSTAKEREGKEPKDAAPKTPKQSSNRNDAKSSNSNSAGTPHQNAIIIAGTSNGSAAQKSGWELLQDLFDPTNHLRAYHDALSRRPSPCIMSIEILLDDLKACDEHETNFEVNRNVLAALGLDFDGLGFESDTSPHSCPSNFYSPRDEEEKEANADIEIQGRAVNRKKLLAMGSMVHTFNRMQKSKYDFQVYDELADFLLSIMRQGDAITPEMIEQMRRDRGLFPPSSVGSSMRSNSVGAADITMVDSSVMRKSELTQSAPTELVSRPDSKETEKKNSFFQKWLGFLGAGSSSGSGKQKKERKAKSEKTEKTHDKDPQKPLERRESKDVSKKSLERKDSKKPK